MKIYTTDGNRLWMPCDGKSSHGLWPSELIKKHTFHFKYFKTGWTISSFKDPIWKHKHFLDTKFQFLFYVVSYYWKCRHCHFNDQFILVSEVFLKSYFSFSSSYHYNNKFSLSGFPTPIKTNNLLVPNQKFLVTGQMNIISWLKIYIKKTHYNHYLQN